MKNLKMIFPLLGIALLTACGGMKDSSRNTAENSRVAPNSSGTTYEVANEPNTTNTDRTEMYRTLNMDNTQIQQFERQSQSNLDIWKKNNPSRQMDKTEDLRSRDKIMKGILNGDQYQQFQHWSKGSSNKN